MSEDWKPGDLAVCVKDHPLYAPQVVVGGSYEVAYVWEGVPDVFGSGPADAALDFVGVERLPGDLAHWARNFRKVRPDQHEPCEEEFATLLNRTKRRVGA